MHVLAVATLRIYDELHRRDPALAARFLLDLKAATNYVDLKPRPNHTK